MPCSRYYICARKLPLAHHPTVDIAPTLSVSAAYLRCSFKGLSWSTVILKRCFPPCCSTVSSCPLGPPARSVVEAFSASPRRPLTCSRSSPAELWVRSGCRGARRLVTRWHSPARCSTAARPPDAPGWPASAPCRRSAVGKTPPRQCRTGWLYNTLQRNGEK